MNRIGGMSNSGEGGEDPVRFHPIEDWKLLFTTSRITVGLGFRVFFALLLSVVLVLLLLLLVL